MNKNKRWSIEENNKLKELYKDTSKEELEKIFMRSYSSICKQASTLGLKKKRTFKSKWTNEEIEFLKNNYDKLTTKSISNKINKTDNQIRNMRSKLNLKLERVIKKWDEVAIKSLCEEQNYIYKDKYTGKHDELRVIVVCEEGHESDKDFNSLRVGSKCIKCLGSERLTIEHVKEEFEKEGYILLTNEYKNAHMELLAECDNGHLIKTTWNNFQQGARCRECSMKKVHDNQRTPYEDVLLEFEKRDCTLISKEYINNQSKLEYICPHHPDMIQSISFSSFKNGHGCKECQKEKLRMDRRIPYEDVVLDFKDKGFIIVSEEESYLNCYSDIDYICEKHKELGVRTTNYTCLKNATISICTECYRDITNGRYSPSFKGGISELKEALRGIITEWKKDSMRNSDYKCVITGEKFEAIHHLYGFNLIVEETLDLLKLPRLPQVKDYTSDQIELIKETFSRIHASYPLGVCLSKEMHSLFHKNYGYGSNTPEQFEDFKNKYIIGEFRDVV